MDRRAAVLGVEHLSPGASSTGWWSVGRRSWAALLCSGILGGVLHKHMLDCHFAIQSGEKARERTVSKKAERVAAEDDEAGEEVAADGSGTYEGYAP